MGTLTKTELRALGELTVPSVRVMEPDDLRQAWARLGQWHERACRIGADPDPIERAASAVLQAMVEKAMPVDEPGDLAAAALKNASLARRLEQLPPVIRIEENHIELACAPGGSIQVAGGIDEYTTWQAAVDALSGVGIAASFADAAWSDNMHSAALYDLALVKSEPVTKSMADVPHVNGAGVASGAMLSVPVPRGVGAALVASGAITDDRIDGLHLTLVYLGPAELLTDRQTIAIAKLAAAVCRDHRPLTIALTGVGVFEPGDEGYPIVALASGPGLSQLQADLERAVSQEIDLPLQHGWVPHVTLGYVPEVAGVPSDSDLPDIHGAPSWTVDTVELHVAGSLHSSFMLLGHVPAIQPDWDIAPPTPTALSIACAAPEKQIIYYLVSEPDTADAHGHRISADAIEDALHGYVANSREVKLEHRDRITGRAVVVEAFIAPADLDTFHGQTPPDGRIKQGSSIVAIHYTDPGLWAELRDTPHGISWGGMAARVSR